MGTGTKEDSGPRFGVRYKQCLLLFGCHFAMYTVVLNVSLAIVAMTDSSKANPEFEEFKWNEQTRATILSSFFWGYICSQIPAGTLITKFGCKNILLIGCTMNALLTLLTPACVFWGGANALLAIRITQGIFQGPFYPATHGLIANWAPVSERSRFSVLVYPGAQLGTVVAMSTGGQIASSSLGWPGIFYIWGAVGIIWCITWWIFGANSPVEHKTISTEERAYILQAKDEHSIKLPTPWKKMFRSRPFYALLIAQTCSTYSFWTINTITPTYLKGVFGIDIRENALLSAVPSIGVFIMSHVFAVLAKFCTNQLKLSLRFIRILFNTIGFEVPATAMIILGFVTQDHSIIVAILLLTVAYGANSAIFFGYYVNHMELCPTHASILMAVANTIGTSSGIFSTLAVGWLVTDETNPKQWQIIFGIGAGLFTFATFVFAFFGRFENQNWVETTAQPNSPGKDKGVPNFDSEETNNSH